MQNKPTNLTHERLMTLVFYNPETGEMRRLIGRDRGRIMKPCASGHGYTHIFLDGRLYVAHHIAWFYVHGSMPIKWIDHINGARSDNRIVNLRLADGQGNAANSRGWKRSGTLKGAYPQKLRWQASIRVNRKLIYLGSFLTEQAAHEAYMVAAKKHFGEFANGGHAVPTRSGHAPLPPIRNNDPTLRP